MQWYLSAPFVNELRQESQKEDRNFRIEDIREYSLPEESMGTHAGGQGLDAESALIPPGFEAEVNQIDCAKIFDDEKSIRRCLEDQRYAEGGSRRMNQNPANDADGRHDARSASMGHPAGNHISHIGTRSNDQCPRDADEQGKFGRLNHQSPP